MASIRLESLRKSFGGPEVVCGVDLEIRDRETMVLVGPSGCGKSTLLRLIAGLEEADAGRIFIGDEDATAKPAPERGLSMVFQSYALYPHKTAGENMGFALQVAGRPASEVAERVARAAEILGLEGLLARKPKELSGGQRQRVAIGRAIVREPRAFLFDEPLSNLDAALRAQTRVEIAKLRRRLSATMVYVTHDQVEAMTLADRIAVLSAGKVEQLGAPLELYENPANLFVATFLGSPQMNILPCVSAGVGNGSAGGGNGTGGTAGVGGMGGSGTDGRNRVRLSGGFEVETARAVSGGEVSLAGIRPEHLELVGDGGNGTGGVLRGRVSVAERLGADTFLHVDLEGGGEAALRASADCKLRPGDAASLRPVPEHLHLFAEDGRALTRGAI